MSVEDEVGGGSFAALINRLRAIVPNLGEVFFVDCDAGVDAPGRGTYALPLATINYAITNYTVAWRNDLILCWGSAGGGFDENLFANGIRLNVPGVIVCGVDHVALDNTNAGATALWTASANSCWVLGFTNAPTAAIIGIDITSDGCKIGHEEYPNVFDGCSIDVQIGAVADGNWAHHNRHVNSSIGYRVLGFWNEIYENRMDSVGGAGTFGVNFAAGTADRNYVRDNVMENYNVGINAVAGATRNVGARNMFACTTTIADANAPNLNRWIGNESRSGIRHTNTVQEDMKDIFNEAEGGGGGGSETPESTRVGDVYFVDIAGSNVTGDGTLGNPWRTITFAVAQCTPNNNDVVIVYSSTGAAFDENAAITGLMINVAGVRVMGVDYPAIQNTNVGATQVVTLNEVRAAIEGCLINTNTIGIFVDINSVDWVIEQNIIVRDGGAPTGITVSTPNRGEIYENTIRNCTVGIDTQAAQLVKTWQNHLIDCTTAFDLNGATAECVFWRNQITDYVGGATSWNVAAACGINSFIENTVLGCAGHILLAETFMSENSIDKIDYLHTHTVANGTAEITIGEWHPWRTGMMTVEVDMAAYQNNEAGKIMTIKLKHKINNINERILDQYCFVSGGAGLTTLKHPMLRAHVEGGFQNIEVTFTSDVAVAGNRDLDVKFMMED